MNNINVAALQETHAAHSEQAARYYIYGYELIATMNNTKYSLATPIRHSLKDITDLEKSKTMGNSIAAIRIGQLTITNTNKPPNLQ